MLAQRWRSGNQAARGQATRHVACLTEIETLAGTLLYCALIHEPAHYPVMNRLAAWTVGVVIMATVAVFDLVSAWAVHRGWVDLVLVLGLFGIAVALFVGLLIAGSAERRWIMASARTSLDIVGRAARGARWSALAAVGLSILLFANCSGGVTGPSVVGGPMDDASGFLKVSAAVLLPIVLMIVLTAVLATAAQVFASRHQGHSALRAAQAGIVSALIIAVVAVMTVPVGFIFGISACYLETSQGACAAGAGSFMNLFAAGTVALMLPYLTLMARVLALAPAPGGPDHPERS